MAPLLFTCGERTTAELLVGWAGTVLSISCLLIAVIIATVAALGAAARRTAHGLRSASCHFALTVVAAAIACCAVLLSRPDELWGTNSWLFFTTGAGLLVCTAGGILRIVLKARASH
ncbi:putative membrane protein [Microbacterium sp. SORGH_AS 862]|nr:putative membrane protein [Microbacterium sp. SORGH_AS_0862]